ncbi:MAG: peptidoglycan-binding protein [Clostridia bacterium]|nr:peptidoglycan-binding protein [Clostridia bacterium]
MAFQQFGIDISAFQAGIDFDEIVSEGVEFVILRGAYHLTKDAEFENFYTQAKARNLPVGVYLYTTATTSQGAREEANFLINNVLRGKQLELPIYIDIEDELYYSRPKSSNTAVVRTFCETLEANNFFTGVYASTYFFATYLDDSQLTAYTHWVAQWSTQLTYPDKNLAAIWQFGGSTNRIRSNIIAGMVVDQNYMYRDFPTIIKAYGLNGFRTEAPVIKPVTPPSDVGTLKKGDRNAGVYLLKQNILLLRKAGVITQNVDDNNIFGDGTETAVRQIQRAAKIKEDGIVGAQTIRAIRNLLNPYVT